MTDYLRLPIGEQVPEVLNAIIEIPLGETNKYEYDKKLHVFRLDRNLFSPVHDGSAPNWHAGDARPGREGREDSRCCQAQPALSRGPQLHADLSAYHA